MAERTELKAARIQRNWTQAQVAELAGVSERAYRAWERGSIVPRLFSVQCLCTVFELDAEALGLVGHADTAIVHAPLLSSLLVQDLTLRLMTLTFTSRQNPAELQRNVGLILEESMQTDPITRREALSRLVALVVAPMAAVSLSGAAIETTFTRCGAAIVACRELGQGLDVALALEGSRAIQQAVIPIMSVSPQHRAPAASLAAQAGILETVFGRHLQGPQASVASGQQAFAYAQVSGDKTLQISALETLAWSQYHVPNISAALSTMERVVVLVNDKHVPLYMHGPAYSALAIMQAAQGLPSVKAFQQAEKMAFADHQYYFVDNPIVTLVRNEAELTYQQKDYGKTVSTLTTHLIDEKTLKAKKYAVSEREHVRALSLVTMATLKAKNKDLERSIALWKPWMQSAKSLNSKLCFGEAVGAYNIMDALWGNDARVQALHPLTIQ